MLRAFIGILADDHYQSRLAERAFIPLTKFNLTLI